MIVITQIISTIASVSALIGTYCLILSYQKKHEIEHTIAKGSTAEGTITELRERPGEGVAPVVAFSTQNGMYKHYSTTYRKWGKYQVGQKVKIYYYIHKSRREFALEDDEPGSLPGTLLKWGIFLCVISYPLIIYRMRGLF